MDKIPDEPVFKAATAAAAAAAAASGGPPQAVGGAPVEGAQWWNADSGFMESDIGQNGAPPMDCPQFGWVDITTDFFNACSELNLGELAQDMLFGLFEAMSAIEMMDPKMDVGMGFSKHDAPPHTFESAVKAGVIKLDDFHPSELIGLFDALFACLVSWLEGNSIDQVLFTCLYLHTPADITNKAVRAFCVVLRHVIVLIRTIIFDSNVSEEEDFQLYGNSAMLNVEPSFGANITKELVEAEDELLRESKRLNRPDSVIAVVNRLRFMRHFYQSIYHIELCMRSVSDEPLINEVYKCLSVASEGLTQIKRTICLGMQPLRGSESPHPFGFAPHRAQPPTFPRSLKIRTRPEAYQFIEELLGSLKNACKVIKMREYYSVLNFFVQFSQKHGQCVLSRSVLQGLFMTSRRMVFGAIPIKDFLCDSMRAFSFPPVLNPNHALFTDRKVQAHLDTFFWYCTDKNTFMQFLRICGYNRARQREKLARFIENFDGLQVEAARLDSHLTMMATEKMALGREEQALSLKHSAQFSTWVLYNCFRAMLMYLLSGFELELYSVHEYIYIYWYPYELLIGFIVSALTRTENNLLAQEELAENQTKPSVGTKKNKAKPKKKKQQGKSYRSEIIYYHGLLNLCGGFFKAMVALTKDGRIRQPSFNNEEIRFNHRFSPFATLSSPPTLSYTDYVEIRNELWKTTSDKTYNAAAKHFEQAMHIFSSIHSPEQEVLNLVKISKVNFIVMNLLAGGHQKDNKKQPQFDFTLHSNFPTIDIKNT